MRRLAVSFENDVAAPQINIGEFHKSVESAFLALCDLLSTSLAIYEGNVVVAGNRT